MPFCKMVRGSSFAFSPSHRVIGNKKFVAHKFGRIDVIFRREFASSLPFLMVVDRWSIKPNKKSQKVDSRESVAVKKDLALGEGLVGMSVAS